MGKKNTSIELMRFVFCMMVVIYHGSMVFQHTNSTFVLFKQGAFGVEFFFVLSGLLIMRHIDRLPDNSERMTYSELGEETLAYVWKKYCAIFPLNAVTFLIMAGELVWLSGYTIKQLIRTLIYGMPEFFMIQMSGLQFVRVNANDWYVSSLLIATLLLYPFMRKFRKLFTRVMAPLLVLISLGFLYQETGGITPTPVWVGFFFKGTVRGITELALGAIAYELSMKLTSLKLNRLGIFLVRVTEIMSYLAVFVFASSSESKKWPFVLLFVVTLGIIITYSQYSALHRISNNRLVIYLGKLTLSIYFCQRAVQQIVEKYYVGHSYFSTQMIYIAGTFVLSIAVQLLVDQIVKFFRTHSLFLVKE